MAYSAFPAGSRSDTRGLAPRVRKQARRISTMAKRKKFWIAGAIKKPGALRAKAKAAGALKDGISPSYLAEKAKEAGTTGKQARLARTLKSFHKGGSSSSKA